MTEPEILKILVDYFQSRANEAQQITGTSTLEHMHLARTQAYRHAAEMVQVYLTSLNHSD